MQGFMSLLILIGRVEIVVILRQISQLKIQSILNRFNPDFGVKRKIGLKNSWHSPFKIHTASRTDKITLRLRKYAYIVTLFYGSQSHMIGQAGISSWHPVVHWKYDVNCTVLYLPLYLWMSRNYLYFIYFVWPCVVKGLGSHSR